MLKASFSKKDIKLKQVLEIFAIEITSIDKDFKFKNKNFGSFIPTGMDDYHNGEIYTSEIFIKKGFFQKKKTILFVKYSWIELELKMEITYVSKNHYQEIKQKIEKYLNRYSSFLTNVKVSFKKNF